jgi:hypothetical protein
MASAAFRSYIHETSEGSTGEAYALLSRDWQRYCLREQFEATIEFERSSFMRRQAEPRLIGIRTFETPQGMAVVGNFSVQTTDGETRDIERGALFVKEGLRWKLAIASTGCPGLVP